jgi:Periplasmic binding protein-like domain
VGYDDIPSAAYACPPLTTIRTHAYEHGKLFAEAAIRLMNKEDIGSQQNVIPLDLIIRESCGANLVKAKSASSRPSSRDLLLESSKPPAPKKRYSKRRS